MHDQLDGYDLLAPDSHFITVTYMILIALCCCSNSIKMHEAFKVRGKSISQKYRHIISCDSWASCSKSYARKQKWMFFFLNTMYITFNQKKNLSCLREAARCFVSLNILPSHSDHSKRHRGVGRVYVLICISLKLCTCVVSFLRY